MPEVSVIVPARDAEPTISRTLSALQRQRIGQPYEVIVVDNGSGDRTAERAEQAPVVDRVIRRRRGAGPGAARNDGAACARGDVLAFIDADCEPTPGWLAAGLGATMRADLIQGRVEPPPGVRVGAFDRTLWVTRWDGLFQSANLFIRRRPFEVVGGFPRGLEAPGEPPFGEDVVFGWRARRAGARTAFCREALAYHAVFPRTASEYVHEYERLRLFPRLVGLVPELRDEFLFRRYFLSRRTAALDLALVALGAAAAGGDARWLWAALPYAVLLAGSARARDRRAVARLALAGSLADLVGARALLTGSLETGHPVL